MPYLLACEVVTQSGSIVCQSDAGEELCAIDIAHRRFGQDLVPQLHECLQRFGRPRALAVAVGPGSFTGLRVSVLAMRTLAWLEQLPVYAVDSTLARAVQAGPGCWWVWQSLKRDTTFHACHRVTADAVQTLQSVTPCLDATCPDGHAIPGDAIVIGDALALKPELPQQWAVANRIGSSDGLHARGVAAAAACLQPVAWQELLPAYHQRSAPELQREGHA